MTVAFFQRSQTAFPPSPHLAHRSLLTGPRSEKASCCISPPRLPVPLKT